MADKTRAERIEDLINQAESQLIELTRLSPNTVGAGSARHRLHGIIAKIVILPPDPPSGDAKLRELRRQILGDHRYRLMVDRIDRLLAAPAGEPMRSAGELAQEEAAPLPRRKIPDSAFAWDKPDSDEDSVCPTSDDDAIEAWLLDARERFVGIGDVGDLKDESLLTARAIMRRLAREKADLRADVERLTKALDEEDRLAGITIDQRDAMEARVNRIGESLGLNEEAMAWSNMNDVADRCVEAIEAKDAKLAEAERNARVWFDSNGCEVLLDSADEVLTRRKDAARRLAEAERRIAEIRDVASEFAKWRECTTDDCDDSAEEVTTDHNRMLAAIKRIAEMGGA